MLVGWQDHPTLSWGSAPVGGSSALSTACASCARPTPAPSPARSARCSGARASTRPHLVDWRRRRDLAVLQALEAQKRGPKGRSQNDAEIAELRRRIAKLERDLSKAHTVIDIQGKVSALLRSELESAELDGL